ncbi:hypothetical protein COBT_003326 [Conglomerata obtusa]
MVLCILVLQLFINIAKSNEIINTANEITTTPILQQIKIYNQPNSLIMTKNHIKKNNYKHKQKLIHFVDPNQIYNRKKRRHVDLNYMPDQNEDGNYVLVKLDPLSNSENREKIIRLEAYKYNNVEYTSKLLYLLQTVLPGVSDLGYEEILHPNQENFDEIVRLIKILKLKAEIAKLDAENKVIAKELARIDEFRTKSIGDVSTTLNKRYSDWTVISSEKSTMIRNKIGRLKVLYDEQLEAKKRN